MERIRLHAQAFFPLLYVNLSSDVVGSTEPLNRPGFPGELVM